MGEAETGEGGGHGSLAGVKAVKVDCRHHKRWMDHGSKMRSANLVF